MKAKINMYIFCCHCNKEVDARLTSGKEVYPYSKDLHELPFWKCDHCNNFVGCHHKTKNRTKPLGIIPTAKIKRYRMMVHLKLDPIWKSKMMKRKEVYKYLSKHLSKEYHTAHIASVEEGEAVLKLLDKLYTELHPLVWDRDW